MVVVPLVVSAPLTASIGTPLDQSPCTLKFADMASLDALPKVSDEARTAVLAAVETPSAALLEIVNALVWRDRPTSCNAPVLTAVGPV